MESCGEGYSITELGSVYGGVKQRWLAVFSEKRHAQAVNTIQTHVTKEACRAKKDLKKLKASEYGCAVDAEQALRAWEKKLKYHKCTGLKIHSRVKRTGRGRPKIGDPGITVHDIDRLLEIDEAKITDAKNSKGFFIIATNEMNTEALPAKELLSVYKNGQQSVERGFRFLKDPRFMTSAIFLKKETRIIALSLVMCLSLLIYTLTQRKIRLALAKQGATVPNQTGKPVKKPTMAWIYECFRGVAVFCGRVGNKVPECMTNMNRLHKMILRLLGHAYEKIYEIAA